MKIEERLIVAADYDPRKEGGLNGVIFRILLLASALDGLGVYIKVNSVLRAFGPELIDMLHNKGLRVFADLKLVDIPNTMETDAAFLAPYEPELLTVMCSAGVVGIRRVQEALPQTEVLGVTLLTSTEEDECRYMYDKSPEIVVRKLAYTAHEAGLGGLVCSVEELPMLRQEKDLELTLNTPGIRDVDASIAKDDQSRIATPEGAMLAGADRIVVGRPIIQAKDPREAAVRMLEGIRKGLNQS